MKDVESKSFETVDLLPPIEMIPIQAIDMPMAEIDHGRKEQISIEDKTYTEPKGVTEPTVHTDPTSVTESAVDTVHKEPVSSTEPIGYTESAVKKEAAEFTEPVGFTKHPEYQVKPGQQVNDQGTTDSFEQPINEIPIDLSKVFREAEESQKRVELEKRKKNSMLIFCAAFFIAAVFMSIAIKGFANREDRERFMEDPYKGDIVTYNDFPTEDFEISDGTYGVIYFDDSEGHDTELVSVNKEIIEYTDIYERDLYFRVIPKEDSVYVLITVDMIDKNGNWLGSVGGTSSGVPKGKEAVVPVFLGISPNMDLNGVTYNINIETYKMDDEVSNREIMDMNVEDGVIYVKVKGDSYLDKHAYMIYYKNDNVVSVKCEGDYSDEETAVLAFTTDDVDFDTSQIYY